MSARAGRKGRRRLGMNLVEGSSSWVRSMTLGVGGGSVFARFGDEERRSMTSAFRLFDGRGPKATLFVLVAGVRADRGSRFIELTFFRICFALTTKAGTSGTLSASP